MVTNTCIISSNDVIRNGLGRILNTQKNINVHLEARDINAVIRLLKSNHLDLILIDACCLDLNIEAIKKVKTIHNNIKLILMSCTCMSNATLLNQTDFDINGFIDNKQNSVEIINAVNSVICGKEYICPSMHSAFLKKSIPNNKSITSTLSNREHQVYCMLGEGKRIKEIAKELSLSPKTVSTHKYRIFNKLNAKNISQVIMCYLNDRQVQPVNREYIS